MNGMRGKSRGRGRGFSNLPNDDYSVPGLPALNNTPDHQQEQGTSKTQPQLVTAASYKIGRGRGKRRGSAKVGSKTAAKAEPSAETSFLEDDNKMDMVVDEVAEHEVRVRRVFQNDLIFKTLGRFLNYGDIQALSQVSSWLYNVTHSYRPFTDGTNFKLTLDGYQKDIYTSKTYPWKSIVCYMDGLTTPTSPLKAKITPVLSYADHLELFLYMHSHFATIPSKTFIYYFTKSPGLKSLVLDHSILNRNLKSVLGKQPVVEIFKKLEDFGVTASIHNLTGLEDIIFQSNVRLLIKIPMNLKSIKFAQIDSEAVDSINTFVELVGNNRNSLNELILHGNMFRAAQLKTLICPLLSKLEVTVRGDGSDKILVAFLKEQPLLRSLSIRHRDGIDHELLKIIQEKCSRLIKLHLKTPFFLLVRPPVDPPAFNPDDDDIQDPDPDNEPDPIPLDISFLGGITTLEEFDLAQRNISPIHPLDLLTYPVTIAGALSALPNSRLNSLSFSGMDPGWIWEETLSAVTALSRFTNITKLSILECEDTLSDEILQFIISAFTLLQVLRISRSLRISRIGFTGVEGEVCSGITLKSLKGLKSLTLVNCPLLVEDDYSDIIQFSELIELDIRPSLPLPMEKFIQILSQNPGLERVYTNSELTDAWRDQVRELPTRIKPEKIFHRASHLKLYTPVGSISEDDDLDWSDDFESSVSGGWGGHEEDLGYDFNGENPYEDDAYDDDDFGFDDQNDIDDNDDELQYLEG